MSVMSVMSVPFVLSVPSVLSVLSVLSGIYNANILAIDNFFDDMAHP